MNKKHNPEEPNKIEKIKQHFKSHKRDYIIAATSVAGTVVAVATTVVIQATRQEGSPQIQQLLNFGPTNARIIYLEERSTPSKPVHLVGTNLYFDSMSDAARKTGHHLSRISQNVNGQIPDVNGDMFELLIPA
jgi:hypothetical protein